MIMQIVYTRQNNSEIILASVLSQYFNEHNVFSTADTVDIRMAVDPYTVHPKWKKKQLMVKIFIPKSIEYFL